MLEQILNDCLCYLLARLDALQYRISARIQMENAAADRGYKFRNAHTLEELLDEKALLLKAIKNIMNTSFKYIPVTEPVRTERTKLNPPETLCTKLNRVKRSRIYKHNKLTRVCIKELTAEEINFRNDGLIVSNDNRQISYH